MSTGELSRLMQGVLADIYPTLADVPVWQRRTRHFDSRRTPECRHGLPGAERETNETLAAIRTIAKSCGLSMPSIALKWPLAPEIIEQLNAVTRPLLEKLGLSFDYYESPANDRTS